jgi:hypothetical protein
MLRKEFIQIVENTVEQGFNRGVTLFLENLEESLGKESIFEQFGGVDNTINALMEQELGEELPQENQEMPDMDESLIDRAMAELEKDGFK